MAEAQRDRFAAAALSCFRLAVPTGDGGRWDYVDKAEAKQIDLLARKAYAIADAMMRARARGAEEIGTEEP